MRVLITGGAKELGRAFSEAVGAQGHRLIITGRDGQALETAEAELRAKGVDVEAHVADLAIELKDQPIAILNYDPGMVDVGLMRRGATMESDDPHQQRISRWARSQCVQGRFTPVEQSAGLLARIVSGEFDHLSGGLITPADR